MTRSRILMIGLALAAAAALPLAISAQDVRPLGPDIYRIAVSADGGIAWRLNTANGTVSTCRAPIDPAGRAAPRCSPWGADMVPYPKR